MGKYLNGNEISELITKHGLLSELNGCYYSTPEGALVEIIRSIRQRSKTTVEEYDKIYSLLRESGIIKTDYFPGTGGACVHISTHISDQLAALSKKLDMLFDFLEVEVVKHPYKETVEKKEEDDGK